MILKTENNILFITDTKRTRERGMEQLMAEHNGRTFRISIDRTLLPPYYELFEEYEEDGRLLHNRLYASTKIQKLTDWITKNL